MPNRIHVFGASGSGATTLGRGLAARLKVGHLDADDYYWERTNPPFTTKRKPQERTDRLQHAVQSLDEWVLSGSLVGWGDVLILKFTIAVYTHVETPTRIDRLRARESARFGRRIEPGGEMYRQHLDFIDWALSYDTASPPTRSRKLHEEWTEKLPCRLLSVETVGQPADALKLVLAALA